MTSRTFGRRTPNGQAVEFSRVDAVHVDATRRDTEDHAFFVSLEGGREQLVLVRIDALAGRHVGADEVKVSGEELAIRHVLRCVDAGTLPTKGETDQPTEIIYDIRPLLG